MKYAFYFTMLSMLLAIQTGCGSSTEGNGGSQSEKPLYVQPALIQVSEHDGQESENYQREIRNVLRNFGEASTKKNVDEIANLFVPARNKEIKARLNATKEEADKHPGTVEFEPLSLTRIGNLCYVTVRQRFSPTMSKGDTKNGVIENTHTTVFVLQDNKEWKILDYLRFEKPFILNSLGEKCNTLAKVYWERVVPWNIDELNTASKEYQTLEKEVGDAFLKSPESAMFATKDASIIERQIKLRILAEINLEEASKQTDGSEKQRWLIMASKARRAAVEALAIEARPVLKVLEVRQEATHTTMEMELHPVVFLANLDEVRKAGFSIRISEKESEETLQYVKTSDFTLMDCSGKKIKASDLGTKDIYDNQKSTFLTKTKEGSVAVQELVTYESPVSIFVRFSTDTETSIPYKIIVRDGESFGILLIRPKSN